MAKKKTIEKETRQYTCRECANSYDWHGKNYAGEPFLCRCKYKQQGGKFCIFLKDPQCANFVKRP